MDLISNRENKLCRYALPLTTDPPLCRQTAPGGQQFLERQLLKSILLLISFNKTSPSSLSDEKVNDLSTFWQPIPYIFFCHGIFFSLNFIWFLLFLNRFYQLLHCRVIPVSNPNAFWVGNTLEKTCKVLNYRWLLVNSNYVHV